MEEKNAMTEEGKKERMDDARPVPNRPTFQHSDMPAFQHSSIPTFHPSASPIGLIAGGGRLPFLVAAGARRQGLRVVCVGFGGYVDKPLADEVDAFYRVGVARPGSAQGADQHLVRVEERDQDPSRARDRCLHLRQRGH